MVFVNGTGGIEFREVFFVDVVALALEVRAVVAADRGTFVPIETEPAEALVDDFIGFVRIAFGIGIFDPEDKGAAVFAGEEPVKKSGAGTSDMEVTGGRGGKTGADFVGRHIRVIGVGLRERVSFRSWVRRGGLVMATAGTAATSVRRSDWSRRFAFFDKAVTTDDDSFDRFAGFGVLGERGVLHALAKFKVARFFAIARRDGLVNIGGHKSQKIKWGQV